MFALLRAMLLIALLPVPLGAQTIRVASFNAALGRDGPGLLLRDITNGKDDQIAAVVGVIAHTAPDILALQSIDWDHDGAALAALAAVLRDAGVDYPHRFTAQPNSGLASDLDLDGDGRLGGPGDAQGYGNFTGQKGMAVLSRYPIRTGEIRDLSPLLWRDLPGALLPLHADGSPFPSAAAQAVQRLSYTAHWVVPIALPGPRDLTLLTFYASPPVFDGPEKRNQRRNHDEILLWQALLDGALGPVPENVVLAGGANLDPFDSDGQRDAIRRLLADPRLKDPAPASIGAALAADQGHRGPNALDTVDWPKVGRLRVDYVLPSSDWRVRDAGVFWPAPGEPGHDIALAASRHRLVWVDLALDIDRPAPPR
ncbi:endonuclease/exonuclease/phosphatase family protein [Pontibaca salina]|uniref:Endonuclease/exonuclease/phosphatase family protein n=1 Tax=Pontibaca salina TaxID=2795731 RepID=A0A934HIA1_9RHOB|nr:endonuclease/exonuclease/phosphatase family protein [Pontibaca salina]MBI6628668.1 endonuclease/exonuclease/phosphatase family protein [Pontibaca salina]